MVSVIPLPVVWVHTLSVGPDQRLLSLEVVVVGEASLGIEVATSATTTAAA
jgi:hypothetical protein